MSDALLPIFPPGSLNSSIITLVWVGMLVVAFFNLRFGWTLSGLVVPGYLTPLILQRPISVVVILVEACLSYFLVWLVFEQLSRIGRWSNVFGRDRFFALLLSSVLIRSAFDGLVLPLAGAWLIRTTGYQFDSENVLHSFGLIVVALIANQFWKPGIIKGMLPVLLPIAVTYVIVRFVLLEWTNFQVSSLAYLYEDIAASMLAAPKAYIILLTSAYIASRMNLRYGWEFNGILIPSLLALQWYKPLLIVTTFLEAFLVLVLGALLLRTPFFRHATIEGGRKLVYFATISFAYKMVLAWTLVVIAPEQRADTYFGFGYLVPTLLAIKMYDKEAPIRIARATLQTSLVSIACASLIGYALTLVPGSGHFQPPRSGTSAEVSWGEEGPSLETLIAEALPSIHARKLASGGRLPNKQEMRLFATVVQTLYDNPEINPEAGRLLESTLAPLGYSLRKSKEGFWCLIERDMAKPWGFYAVNTRPGTKSVVVAPFPHLETGAVRATPMLASLFESRGIAVGGADVPDIISSGARLSDQGLSLLATFASALESEVIVARSSLHDALGQGPGADTGIRAPALVRLAPPLSANLDLAALQNLIPGLRIEWGIGPGYLPALGPEAAKAEIWLGQLGLRSLLSHRSHAEEAIVAESSQMRFDGYFRAWVLERKEWIARKGSNLYRPPNLEDLLFLDEEVLVPLLAAVEKDYGADGWSESGLVGLEQVAYASAIVGYELVSFKEQATGQEYLILRESEEGAPRRYWGTYAIRLGDASSFMVEVPRPLFELNTFEYGVTLFDQLNAKALFVAGANPDANEDGASDILQIAHQGNVFNLARQVLFREFSSKPMLSIQVRAFGFRPDAPSPAGDAVLAYSSGADDDKAFSPQEMYLVRELRDSGVDLEFAGTSFATAGYEVGYSISSMYLDQTENKEIAALWLSPLFRRGYQQQEDNLLEMKTFASVGIPTSEADLATLLFEGRRLESSASVPEALRAQVQSYVVGRDVVSLYELREDFPGYGFRRVVDLNSRAAYLVIEKEEGAVALLANLSRPRPLESVVCDIGAATRDREALQERVREFVESNAMWLEFMQAP